jgi:hypothetical protein
MSEEGPSGRLNQRGRPMVLLPRVNASCTEDEDENVEFWRTTFLLIVVEDFQNLLRLKR